MLRFEEEVKVVITNQDFKQVKSSVIEELLSPKKVIERKQRSTQVINVDSKDQLKTMPRNKYSISSFILNKGGGRGKSLQNQESSVASHSKLVLRAQSPKSLNKSFSVHKTQSTDKTIPVGKFVVSRTNTSADGVRRSPSTGKVRSLFTRTTETTTAADEIAITSVRSAWEFIEYEIRTLNKTVLRQTFLKMFSYEARIRVQKIIEKKKDEMATKQMKTLETKYGKKIALLYKKPLRYIFMNSVESWKGADQHMYYVFKLNYAKYEIAKLDQSFVYAAELLKVKPTQLSESYNYLPKLAENFPKVWFIEKSRFWPLRNLQLFKKYVYQTEDLLQRLLFYISKKNREILKQYRRLQLEKIEETASKKHLLELVNLMSFRGDQNKNPFLQECADSPLMQSIMLLVAERATQRIDWQLTNLFVGYSFFTYYCARRNQEKGYVILTRAYQSNKFLTNVYLSTYVKYVCTRDQLNYYLNEEDRKQPSRAVFEDVGYVQYMDKLIKLSTRLPFLYDYLENSLFPCLTIEELKNIFKSLGKMALKLEDYENAVVYFENYMFMVDSIDRVNIHRLLKLGKSKEDKVNEILLLNKLYMKYNNRILKACFETKNYVKCLTLIVNILFIFNNSLNLMNYFDPNRHPSKKPNEILMTDLSAFEQMSEVKQHYKLLMVFYIQEWRTAMDLYGKIWIIVSSQHKKAYKQSFFLAFRESIDHIETLNIYNLTNFLAFVGRYTNLPSILETADRENMDNDNLMKQNYQTRLQMDYYFPTYVGNFDKNFIDYKVLELIYMSAESQANRIVTGPSVASQKNIFKDTEAFKSKRVKKLLVWEVDAYYSILSESELLLNQLFRNVLYRHSQDNNKHKAGISDYFNTILRDADKESITLLRANFTRLGNQWKRVLDSRLTEYQRLQNRKILSHADRFRLKLKPLENQNTVNNFLPLEKMNIVPPIYKKTKFYSQAKEDISIHNLDFGLSDYEVENQLRFLSRRKLRKTKSVMIDRGKITTDGVDMVNIPYQHALILRVAQHCKGEEESQNKTSTEAQGQQCLWKTRYAQQAQSQLRLR